VERSTGFEAAAGAPIAAKSPLLALKLQSAIAVVVALASGASSAAWAANDQISAPAGSPASGPASGLLSNASFEAATGVDYSVGRYGATADTSVVSVPLDLKAQLGRLRVEGVLPYEFLKGPGQLVGGVIVSTPGNTAITKRSGIGDLNLSAAYLLVRESGFLPSIELGGGVKLPTANSGIGTGKTDYTLTANMYKSITPTTMLFGSVGYSWLGSPAAYRLRNGIVASGGLNFRPAPNQNYGVSIAYREPVADGLKGQALASPYMTYRASKRFGLTLYGVAGLNNASPRAGAGIRLSMFI
jgi:hypothetical protein